MDIAKKKLETKIENATFIFTDPGIEEFSNLLDMQRDKKILEQYKIVLNELVGIEGITNNGEAVTLEQFKAMEVSTGLAVRLINAFITCATESAISEFGIDKRQAEKNAESPTALNGSFTDHA